MRTGYLGPPGTYTEEAAALAVPDAERVPFATIDAVFRALANGEIARGLVPIENVIQGPVTETLDNLYTYAKDVTIADMSVLRIEHAIGAFGAAADVRRIRSKDQALKQCSDYLSREFPGVVLESAASTGAAIEDVVAHKKPDVAAIGSEAAMRRHGLPVLASNIGNVSNNKTRFALLSPASHGAHTATGNDATAFVIYPPSDRVGILEEILSIISRDYGLSLCSIHSRPDTRGAHRFYMEIEGHVNDDTVVACLATLRETLADDSVEVRVFGSYPRCPFNEARIKTIGIIGGSGQMGQWLKYFFENAGYAVQTAGRKTKLSYADCVASSDVVVINVPIRHTLRVIKEVAPHLRPGQLIADNTSIKTQPITALLDAAADGVEVLGMHTVFGPSAASLSKQNVIFTRTDTCGPLAEEFQNIFYKHGAYITFTDAHNHDRQMAFHQNLEHFSKLVLAQVLCDEFDDASEMDSYSSPNSRASLATMGRVLCADPKLLDEIQAHNMQGLAMIRAYVSAAQNLLDAMQDPKSGAVAKNAETSAARLGAQYLYGMRERTEK